MTLDRTSSAMVEHQGQRLDEFLGALGAAIPTGAMLDFAGAAAPSGWLLCDGAAVSRTTYAALFAIVGTTYGGGNGSTTFNLPDLRGRVTAGKDDMGGSAANRLTSAGGVSGVTLGAAGGEQVHTLTTAEMPQHNHTAPVSTPTGTAVGVLDVVQNMTGSGVGAAIATSGQRWQSGVMSDAGADEAHPNVQPTLIVTKIIKT